MTSARRARRERGSLPLAMLVVIVVGGLIALLVPMLTVQIQTTSYNQARARVLTSAEGGVTRAVGAMRAATSLAELPCGAAATVGGTAAVPVIDVRIAYYRANPSGKDATWLADGANKITCGTNGSKGVAEMPQFALVQSSANGGLGTRTLRSVYAFGSGGTVYLWSVAGTKYCLTVSDTAVAGASATLSTCNMSGGAPAPLAGQRWTYTSDGTVKWSGNPATGALCLANSGGVKLAVCATGDATQQWSPDTANAGRLKNGAKWLTGTAGGGALSVGTTAGTDTTSRWVLSPFAGAGPAAKALAGTNYRQYVNFQTSRCLDATVSVGLTAAARMCATVLTVSDLTSSPQGVTLDASKKLIVGAGTYCLKKATASGADVAQIATCANTTTTWTISDSDRTISVQGTTQCLSVATSTDKYTTDGSPTLLLQTCNAADPLQQWAPRSDKSGAFGLYEVAGSTPGP